MDMMPFEDFDALEQRVQEMVKRHILPPEVTRVAVCFGDLRDGDPAVWVDLYLHEEKELASIDGQVWADIMTTLSREARDIVPGRSPAVRLLVDQSRH